MDKHRFLIERGLLNSGLVPLTPQLVERYNRCLIRAGIEPTKQREIAVDGIGWSPQVAAERQDRFYMCNGIVNPVAVILCPEQYNKPIYFHLFSWMRPLVRYLFDKEHGKIIDITVTHAILIDLENGLSTLEGPPDLLALSEVRAVPDTGELAEAAIEQKRLIERFRTGRNSCEADLQNAIRNNRRKVGDLRKRNVDIGELVFDQFQDFYTVAFGGSVVLRNVDGRDLLILEDEATYNSLDPQDGRFFFLHDPKHTVFDVLASAKWFELPIEKFKANPKLLVAKRELLLGWSLCDCEPGIVWDELSQSKRKSLIKKHEGKVPKVYHQLERFIASLKVGKDPEVSQELWYFLAEPWGKLHPATQDVLWLMLTRRDPRRILRSYTVDKNYFLHGYDSWSKQKQLWAANYLAARYQPRMLQS